MWKAVDNINWMARSMDWSQKSTKQAMEDQVRKLQAGVNQTAKLSAKADAANKIAQQALEAQTRPWIGIDGDARNISVDATTIQFDLPLRNYGHSPAIVVPNKFVIAELGKEEFRYWSPDIGRDLCDFERLPGTDRDEMMPRLTMPVFPNATVPETLHVIAERPDNRLPIGMPDDISGCIVYNATRKGFYTTKVIYRIQYSDISVPHAPKVASIKLVKTETQ
jgi:hypothetical protein